MLKSDEVLKSFGPLRGISDVSEIKYTHMSCEVMNMSYFDIFNELNLTGPTGSIRGAFEQGYMGIILGDKIRLAMLMHEEFSDQIEDETIFEANDKLKEEQYSNEFIFKLM